MIAEDKKLTETIGYDTIPVHLCAICFCVAIVVMEWTRVRQFQKRLSRIVANIAKTFQHTSIMIHTAIGQ